MKLPLILSLAFLLISCGGGSDNNNSKPLDQNSIYIQLFDNTGLRYTADTNPLKGIIVQLDHDGQTITSDSNGMVTFTNLSAGTHDFHVFGTSGYEWISQYNANKGELYKIHLSNINIAVPPETNTNTSVLPLGGVVTNFVENNSYRFYFMTKSGVYHTGFSVSRLSNKGNIYSVYFDFDLPTDTTVSGDLIVFEYQWDTTGNESTLVDTLTLKDISFNTKATTDTLITQDITLSVQKPAKSNVLALSNLQIPDTLLFRGFNIGSYSESSSTLSFADLYGYSDRAINLTFPKTITSYRPFDYQVLIFSLSADLTTPGYSLSWYIDADYPVNSTVNIKPEMTILPTFPDNQTGDEIRWTASNAGLTKQSLFISGAGNSKPFNSWYITLDPKASKVRLPTIPTGVTPILTIGQTYRIKLDGRIRKLNSYNETFTLHSDTWTR